LTKFAEKVAKMHPKKLLAKILTISKKVIKQNPFIHFFVDTFLWVNFVATFSTDLNSTKNSAFLTPQMNSQKQLLCALFMKFLGSLKLNTPKMTQNRKNVF
jgi:hypothetical protein